MRTTIKQLETKIKTLEKKLREYEQIPAVIPPLINLSKITFNPPEIVDRIEYIHT